MKFQWWWYEVRQPHVHERTYLRRSDAISFASVSQKIRGGVWIVRRRTKNKILTVALFDGVRHE